MPVDKIISIRKLLFAVTVCVVFSVQSAFADSVDADEAEKSDPVFLVQNYEDGAPSAAERRLEQVRITVRGMEVPLGNLLNQIARSAGLSLVVDKDVRLETIVPSVDLHEAPLDEALAVLLTPQGYSYEVDSRRNYLRVYIYAMRTFRVAMPVVVQEWNTEITNASGGGASDLGATIGLKTRSDTVGLWEELERSLSSLLEINRERAGGPGEQQTPALGSFSVNRTAGFATIRALPTVMPAIESYFAALNSEMGRSITVEIKVMQVDLRDDRATGIDWGSVMYSLGDVALGTGSNLAGTTHNDIYSGRTTGATPPHLRLSGLGWQAMLGILEEQGKVSVLAQPTLVLGNNLPSIIELAEVVGYTAEATTTMGQQGGFAQTTVRTGTLSDGLIVSVIPRVLETGDISLALGIILQDIVEIRPFVFQGGAVQLPHTSRRSYSGVVRSRVGETVVLAGLITSRKESRTKGLPFISRIPVLGIFFGQQEAASRNSELILTITPREVQTITAPRVPVSTEPEGW